MREGEKVASIEETTVLFDYCIFLHVLASEVLKYTLFYEQTLLDWKKLFIMAKKIFVNIHFLM